MSEWKGLIGKTFTVTLGDKELSRHHLRTQKWTVAEVHPHFVIAERICENGYIVREGFDIGELVKMGILVKSQYGYDIKGGSK